MSDPTREQDALLDSLGTVLRLLGRYSFDLDQIDRHQVEDLFERWAQHATIGQPPPGGERAENQGDLAHRDWAGLRDFVLNHRRREQAFVTRSHRDFRQVIRSCVDSMTRVVSEESRADAQVKTQLVALQAAVESNRIEDIKRVARMIIVAVDKAIDDRKQRQENEMQRLNTQVSSLGAELESAKREGGIDGLTTVHNRKAFDEHVKLTIEMVPVVDETVCLLMLDVDHFKTVNDTYGHVGGDAVLRAVALLILRTFKRKRDFVARYGGEEFAIVINDVTLHDAEVLANRLLKAFRETPVPFEGQQICVTASGGLSMLDRRETGLQWIDRADQALYQAKRAGRDRVVVGAHPAID